MTVTINKTSLVPDANGVPIQGVFHPLSTVVKTIGAASVKTSTGFLTGIQIVQLYATVACYVRFSQDGSDATSADWILPAGVLINYALKGATYIAALEVGSGGSLYITTLN